MNLEPVHIGIHTHLFGKFTADVGHFNWFFADNRSPVIDPDVRPDLNNPAAAVIVVVDVIDMPICSRPHKREWLRRRTERSVFFRRIAGVKTRMSATRSQ